MKTKKLPKGMEHITDPDILGSWPALVRAGQKARQLSIATGTPFWVVQDGKIVDLNKKSKRRKNPGSKKS